MDIKDIKQLIQLVETSSVTEIEVEDKGFKVRISRHQASASASAPPAAPAVTHVVAPSPQLSAPPFPVAAPVAIEEGITVIKSPMVGTFYGTPSPESDPFVKVGSQVKETSVVCIIEAMKVMNEIQAELSGRITEVLVSSGQSVEYGQPLFKVKKA